MKYHCIKKNNAFFATLIEIHIVNYFIHVFIAKLFNIYNNQQTKIYFKEIYDIL